MGSYPILLLIVEFISNRFKQQIAKLRNVFRTKLRKAAGFSAGTRHRRRSAVFPDLQTKQQHKPKKTTELKETQQQ